MSGEAPITVCKGICGLGNRLLFLTEVMRRCQRVGSRLYVSWNDYMYSDTPNENAFPRAFVLHPRFDAGVREIRQLCDLSVWPPMWAGLLDKDIYSLPERYREISEASVALRYCSALHRPIATGATLNGSAHCLLKIFHLHSGSHRRRSASTSSDWLADHPSECTYVSAHGKNGRSIAVTSINGLKAS